MLYKVYWFHLAKCLLVTSGTRFTSFMLYRVYWFHTVQVLTGFILYKVYRLYPLITIHCRFILVKDLPVSFVKSVLPLSCPSCLPCLRILIFPRLISYILNKGELVLFCTNLLLI